MEPRVKGQAGGAVVLALMVSATLAAVGLAALQIADVSGRIAARARDRDAVLHVAETGARAVKRWFDAPIAGDRAAPSTLRNLFLFRHDVGDASRFDRTRRLLDSDGDPSTAPVAADGTSGREWYRQGRDDLFHKPFRGDAVTTLMGSAQGPDLLLEDDPDAVDLLDRINAALFETQAATGRLERIEIHAPPAQDSLRLGMAAVQVTASIPARMILDEGIPVAAPGAATRAASVVRMGLAEIPYNQPRGPMATC
jgi:hypothetical protein